MSNDLTFGELVIAEALRDANEGMIVCCDTTAEQELPERWGPSPIKDMIPLQYLYNRIRSIIENP